MPRGRGMKQFFTFVKGWNTEATPTGFPENSAIDLDNVILDVDGSIRRRPGLDFERNFSKFGLALEPADVQKWAISFHEWGNVGSSGNLAFAVSQYGLTLHFHRLNGDATSATPIGTVDMTPFAVDITLGERNVVAVDDGMGVLFVCGQYINPFYVSYDGTSLSTTQVDITIRDFVGVDDGLGIEENPTTLSALHHYNLLNQAWPTEPKLVEGNTKKDVITEYFNKTGTYPSNAQIWYLGQKPSGGTGFPEFFPETLDGFEFGNTHAPRGRFLLNAFNQDRSGSSGITDVTNTIISSRPEAVAFHNGRVFWAGVADQGFTGNIYFSQQLIDLDRAGNCYQEQDPTAEEFNDLLATDGGVITIPNAGRIRALREGGDGVIAFTSNGVWHVTGSDGRFSATDFAIVKVSDVGCIGADTVVEADGVFFYWSDAGIIALQRDDISSSLKQQNITKNTIQTGYLLIGGIQRRFARGVFITEEKKVVWLYSTDLNYDGINDRYKYNGVLILDSQLGAFYKYSISDTASSVPYAAGVIKTLPFTAGDVSEVVTVGGVTVTVSGVDVTTTTVSFTGADISSWKLLNTIDSDTTGKVDFTMSEFYSRSFHDWFKTDGTGVNYTSFLETGYETMGNVVINKQPAWVFTYFSPLSKSLKPGSYYELPSLIGFSSGFRVTQTAKETLGVFTSKMRTTQVAKEILADYASEMRTTQCVKETLIEVT